MLKDIFAGTPRHEYYLQLARDEVLPQVCEEEREEIRKEAREEERQERLKAQRKLLLLIVQTRFPTLTQLARTQARQIKDVAVVEKVVGKVSTARTTEEAMNALVSCLPNDDAEI
jgi:hypothetical protein